MGYTSDNSAMSMVGMILGDQHNRSEFTLLYCAELGMI